MLDLQLYARGSDSNRRGATIMSSWPRLRKDIVPSLLGAVLSVAAVVTQSVPVGAQGKPISEQEAQAIAGDAYLYRYPLVLMDLTRRQMTNVQAGKEPGSGPPNTFNS